MGKTSLNEGDIITFEYAANAHWGEIDSYYFLNASNEQIKNLLTSDFLSLINE